VAEFTSLRGEITVRAGAQAAIVGTGFAGLSALLLVKHPLATQLVPIMACLVSLIYLAQGFYMDLKAVYLRTVLHPEIRKCLPELSSVPDWEDWLHRVTLARGSRLRTLLNAVVDAAIPMSFAVLLVVAWLISPPQGGLLWGTIAVITVTVATNLGFLLARWKMEPPSVD